MDAKNNRYLATFYLSIFLSEFSRFFIRFWSKKHLFFMENSFSFRLLSRATCERLPNCTSNNDYHCLS
eukprot:UN07481